MRRIRLLRDEMQPESDRISEIWKTSGADSLAQLSPKLRAEIEDLEAVLAPLREKVRPLRERHDKLTEYTAWSEPYEHGFHDPSRFGMVRFGE